MHFVTEAGILKVDLSGKPAFLADIKYGDLFYTQIGEHVYTCIKAFLIKNDTELVDYVVAFMPSERDKSHLPRLVEAQTLTGKSAYRISDPVFRHFISDTSVLLHNEYWPTPGIVIESSDATYLTVKSGRMAHRIMYLNIGSGELISAPPKAPFVFVLEWKISLQLQNSEQTLIRFPAAAPPVRLVREAIR